MDDEQDSQDIVITYDTLFEILRNEKTKEDLQKLNNTFFNDVVGYLNEKQKDINDKKDQQGLFDSEDRETKLHQIGNIKKILKDIYERREKKIINMAVNKSRFSSNIIDTSSLLQEEKLFYEMIISLLDSQRDKILKKLLNGEKLEAYKGTSPEDSKYNLDADKSEDRSNVKDLTPESKFKPADTINKTKLIRFLTAVPQFMGEDMKDYGPYEEEDVANVPEGIANLLIEKERAEEINEN
jgi:DNA replication initiation complex subunit (GINS family)